MFCYAINPYGNNVVEMRAPKNSAELFELLLKYESKHETDCGRLLGSAGQRVTRSN